VLLLVCLQDQLAAIKGSSRETEQLQQQVEEQSTTIRSLQVRRRRTMLVQISPYFGSGFRLDVQHTASKERRDAACSMIAESSGTRCKEQQRPQYAAYRSDSTVVFFKPC
jgi:hypothetical protein